MSSDDRTVKNLLRELENQVEAMRESVALHEQREEHLRELEFLIGC